MTAAETLILATYFFVLRHSGCVRLAPVLPGVPVHEEQGQGSRSLPAPLDQLPVVTIQLPIYNEMYVADRLIDAVCQIEYPRELLEIQVLDDSTDETTRHRRAAVRRNAAQGIDITYLHRTDRTGYKAGALEAGMKVAKGEFIAIFDADFIPTDGLPARAPCRTSPIRKIAMVQARWGHINQDYSLLTKIQSILLDGHFVLEHGGRNRAGCFFNFNGTAGIWRRDAIVDAGGWQHDTLTEDLDLSYRAQLRGWRFVFLPDLVAPAEVPVEMNSFKSQQHRWAKGSIQTCRKLLPRILRSRPAVRGQGRGVLPPDGELQLPAHVRAVGADGAGDGHPLQHGLVRDAAHRRAAVLRGDGVGGQFLHGLPARAAHRLDDAASSTCRS